MAWRIAQWALGVRGGFLPVDREARREVEHGVGREASPAIARRPGRRPEALGGEQGVHQSGTRTGNSRPLEHGHLLPGRRVPRAQSTRQRVVDVAAVHQRPRTSGALLRGALDGQQQRQEPLGRSRAAPPPPRPRAPGASSCAAASSAERRGRVRREEGEGAGLGGRACSRRDAEHDAAHRGPRRRSSRAAIR